MELKDSLYLKAGRSVLEELFQTHVLDGIGCALFTMVVVYALGKGLRIRIGPAVKNLHIVCLHTRLGST